MSDRVEAAQDHGSDTVTVEVPASSANLGPGFDAFAVALDLTLTVSVVEREPRRVIADGDGAGEVPAGDDNLIWRAVEAYCAEGDLALPDVSVRAANAIPLERGLGSSAAAAVAGVVLARSLCGGGASQEQLVAIAAGLEGHPDNAAAAALGGLVVCHSGRFLRLEPSDRLAPVICIPTARQSTEQARRVLPQAVALEQAAANGARAAAVLAGLTGLVDLDPDAMTDVLHEPHRFAVMPVTGRLVGALRSAGVPAALSGAGPSALAVVPAGDDAVVDEIRSLAGADWDVRGVGWDLAGALTSPPLPPPEQAPHACRAQGRGRR